MRHCVTIYTDASVCMDTGVAAYAVWAKDSDSLSLQKAGAFKQSMRCSTYAALCAIANGVALVLHALKNRYAGRDVLLVIVTDSEGAKIAIDKYRGAAATISTNQRRVVDAIFDSLPNNVSLKVNKVKAHSTRDGKRSYVNSVVDRECRTVMRAARQQYLMKAKNEFAGARA